MRLFERKYNKPVIHNIYIRENLLPDNLIHLK
jgi:hypothetical protein